MHAYQFHQMVSESHQITIDLPPHAPSGTAQIIVMFPDAEEGLHQTKAKPTNLAQYTAWLEAHPRKGRSAEEIDRYIREERDSWED